MFKTRINRFFFSIPLMISTLTSSAQDKLVALDNRPIQQLDPTSWIWVGGAAVFIFLLVIVLRIGTRRADM